MSGWSIERATGSAGALHARELPDRPGRALWVLEVDAPALVLGSTQAEADVDHDAARRLAVEVVRRRSGGGAVLLDPGEVVWVDLVLPAGDPLWHDDVAVAAEWVGEVWSAALAAVGLPGGRVHRGGLVRTPLAPVVCFAGTGPGEVLVEGAKVVGISQRRTRAAARFQCSVPLAWRPDRHVELLEPGLRRVSPDLAPDAALAAVPVRALHDGVGLDPDRIVDALVELLP